MKRLVSGKLIAGLAAAIVIVAGGAWLASAQGPAPNTIGGGETQTALEPAIGDFWAVQRSDGVIMRCRGCISGSRLALGNYQILFSDNIRGCVFMGTIGDFDALGVSPTGEITTVGRVSDPRGVFITTHTSAGANADGSHHIYVSCDRPAVALAC